MAPPAVLCRRANRGPPCCRPRLRTADSGIYLLRWSIHRKTSVCSYGRHTPMHEGVGMELGGRWSGNSVHPSRVFMAIDLPVPPTGTTLQQHVDQEDLTTTMTAPHNMSHVAETA